MANTGLPQGTGDYHARMGAREQWMHDPLIKQAMASAPAGWYPDPSGVKGNRYWDGFAWSESVVIPQAERRITIHYGFALLAVFALLGTILPSGLMFAANVGNAETSGAGTTMAVLWLLWGGMWTVIWAAFAVHHTLKSR